jgi:tRNA (guanine26-N2/guanine27-N2)-dimethyltransferase
MSTTTSTPTFPVPPGHKAVKERNATILLPDSNTTFLNPIQEYNRDLSVAVIKRFMQDTTDASRTKFDSRRAKRSKKGGKQGVWSWI